MTETAMAKQVSVRPCLTFKEGAEKAVKFYVSVFPNSKVVSTMRSDGKNPMMPEGSLLHASFVLDGQEYTAFDGGEHFEFSDAFSLLPTSKTQHPLTPISENPTPPAS